MSIYYIKIKKYYLNYSAGEGILLAVNVRASITHALCPSSCREFWDVWLPFYCNSSGEVRFLCL